MRPFSPRLLVCQTLGHSQLPEQAGRVRWALREDGDRKGAQGIERQEEGERGKKKKEKENV